MGQVAAKLRFVRFMASHSRICVVRSRDLAEEADAVIFGHGKHYVLHVTIRSGTKPYYVSLS